MAAPGTALAANTPQQEKRPFDYRLAVTLLLNFALILYGYGQLNERVEELRYEVRELRTVVLNAGQHAQR